MIYVVTHKDMEFNLKKGYLPIQVGYVEKNFSSCIRDNTKDNISYKNNSYCELTAFYWIWKNCQDAKKGLVHYRRYFAHTSIINYRNSIYELEELDRLLSKHDIIMPNKEYYHVTVEEQISRNSCTKENMAILRAVILEKYPKYIDDYDNFMLVNKMSQYNMMYSSAEIFDTYARWLFDILFEYEKRINLDSLGGYRKRIFGFVAERLLNVWVIHNRLNVKYVKVLNTENSLKQNITVARRNITNEIRYIFKNMNI